MRAEIASADRIDLVMAFIRRTGINPLIEALRRHVEEGKPLRVLTTAFTGSTEAEAIEALIKLGAQVRVSYDTTSTRLHAKAWLFHRDSGYSTAYVGSSNLTHSAQVTGLEWNVRVSGARNRAVIEKISAVFESYWQQADFEQYDRERLLATSRAAASRVRRHHQPDRDPARALPGETARGDRIVPRAGPPSQSPRIGDRHGKDRHGGGGLRAPKNSAASRSAAFRRAPGGNSRPEPGNVRARVARRKLRRVLGRRRQAARIRSRLRVDPVAQRQWRRGDRPVAFRRRHRRRVPPRRGCVVRAASHATAAGRAAWPDRHAGAIRMACRSCTGSATASPPSFASGMPSTSTGSCRSRTSVSRTIWICATSRGGGAVGTTSSV